jgi:hypothetical protein
MAKGPSVVVSGLVEGPLDEVVLARLLSETGAALGTVYGRKGKGDLLGRLARYNEAARFSPWAVLVDLDRDAECAPQFRKEWLPEPAPHMCFRVVVRAVEAWLLADRQGLADYLQAPLAKVPAGPEQVNDPKDRMVALARLSRRKAILEDMVPRPGGGSRVGTAYVARLIEFARDHWRPAVAARNADSLRRCCERLHELVQGAT